MARLPTPTLQAFAGAIVSIAILGGGTAAAATARSSECSDVQRAVQGQIDAACPCAGATVHGEYLRCVIAKLRELSACHTGEDGSTVCGPVPRQCLGRIRRDAARSACGMPNAVTCCIPRQHDCVGDPKPGDGDPQGTCTESDRRCDRVADCAIPRCRFAPSAERCRLAGGTPGTGADCSNACAP